MTISIGKKQSLLKEGKYCDRAKFELSVIIQWTISIQNWSRSRRREKENANKSVQAIEQTDIAPIGVSVALSNLLPRTVCVSMLLAVHA